MSLELLFFLIGVALFTILLFFGGDRFPVSSESDEPEAQADVKN